MSKPYAGKPTVERTAAGMTRQFGPFPAFLNPSVRGDDSRPRSDRSLDGFRGPVLVAPVLVLFVVLLSCAEPKASSQPETVLGPNYYPDIREDRCCTIIAHAGGAIHGNSYTNSKQAVESNYAAGVRLFEIDFLKTSDDRWVGGHDWDSWKARSGHEGTVPVSFDTYIEQRLRYRKSGWAIAGRYDPVTLEWLTRFLREHSDATVITDIKDLELLQELVSAVVETGMENQFIIQVYRPFQIGMVKERSPDLRMILTLYRLPNPTAALKRSREQLRDLFALTVPMNWAWEEETMKELQRSDIPILLHGSPANVNSRTLHLDFAAKGVAGFYLD